MKDSAIGKSYGVCAPFMTHLFTTLFRWPSISSQSAPSNPLNIHLKNIFQNMSSKSIKFEENNWMWMWLFIVMYRPYFEQLQYKNSLHELGGYIIAVYTIFDSFSILFTQYLTLLALKVPLKLRRGLCINI